MNKLTKILHPRPLQSAGTADVRAIVRESLNFPEYGELLDLRAVLADATSPDLRVRVALRIVEAWQTVIDAQARPNENRADNIADLLDLARMSSPEFRAAEQEIRN